MQKRKPTNTPGSLLAQSKAKKIGKNKLHEAAVEFGRSGGMVGGPARAAALSSKRLTAIAIHAACARWGTDCYCGEC